MLYFKRVVCAAIAFALLLAIFSGCENTEKTLNNQQGRYSSFRDIPGVTQIEIDAVEYLLANRSIFVYAATPSAEAFVGKNNEINGYSALFCEWLSELFGIPFILQVYAWGDLLDGLESGEIDFTGEMTLTEERINPSDANQKPYYMTADAIAERTLKCFHLAGSRPISNITGRPVKYAILKDTTTINEVMSALSEGTYEIVPIDDSDVVYDMLRAGLVDAYINEGPVESIFDTYGDVIAEDFYPMVYSPVSLTTQNPELKEIISIVQKTLENGGKQYLSELYSRGYQEYLVNKLFLQLTKEEREYLQNNTMIPFAAEYDNYPVAFYSKYDKEWQGIGIDVIHEIEKYTGLRFEIINSPTTEWSVLLRMLENGEVFMISELIRTQSREGRFIWPNNVLMGDTHVLISKSEFRNLSAREIPYVTVGLSKNTAHTEFFERMFPNHPKREYYDDSDLVLGALSRGEVDLMMTSYNKLLKVTNYGELVGYKVNVMFDDLFKSTYGFNKDEELLCSIVDKALNIIDTDRISAYWLNKTFDYNAKILQARQPWLIGTAILSLLTAILIIILFVMKRRERGHLVKLIQERTAELAAEKATLLAIFDSIPDFVFCKDVNSIYTRCNKKTTDFFGVQEANIIGRGDLDGLLVPAEIARRFNEYDRATIIDGQVTVTEEPVSNAYGDSLLCETIRVPIFQNGVVTGIVGISRDITERKKAEDALQAISQNFELENATLKAIFDSIPDFIFCKDLNLKYTRCNKKMEEHFGIREETLIGKDDADGLGAPPEMVQACNASDQKLLSSGQPTISEEWIPGAGGRLIACETIKVPIIISNHIVGLTGVSRDVTERKKAEEALRLRDDMISTLNKMSVLFLSQDEMTYEDKLSSGVGLIADMINLDRVSIWRNNMSTDGLITSQIYRWDKNSAGITLPNPELQNLFLHNLMQDWDKIATGEKVLNGPVKLMDNPPPALEYYNVISALVTPLKIHNEWWGFALYEDRKNERFFSADEVETMCSAAMLCVNTIMRSEMESKLNEALQNVTVASHAKSDFLSHMSHEIRTPLNAIIGMINIGMNTDDIEKTKYCLNRANSASKHLLGIINDILDMSKIEADKFELSYGEIAFEKMLMNITDFTNIRADEKRQNFVINLHNNVPDCIEGDELRLSQVITNLLSNAIKFTPENGTITLNVEKTEEIGDDVFLRIEVVDSGIGISLEQQEQLFKSFSQADASITKKYGGTGLGLAISKRIVELMGGEIWVESEPGAGAKFIFTMKAKKMAYKPRTKLAANIKPENMRILAVDDSSETREYFTHVMETLKLSCDVASGGAEALGMIKNNVEKPYNIFFVDWQVPEMNGIELTKKIKEINGENSIVIMISVADWNVLENEAIAAGVRHFISKPLFPSALINAINICLGEELTEDAGDAKESKTKKRYDFTGHTLLVAEDVEINREIMGAILEETDISIDYAENGKIAVSMFCEDPEKYNLVLMDINMPIMDGYEATRQLRTLDIPRAKDIPIIAMTANVFREDIEKCLDSGMNDHTGKPIDANALFGLLDKYLKHPDETRRMKNLHELEEGVAWSDDLLTGNTLVDMQHQKIFERVSDLVRSCEDGSDKEKLQDTLEFLVNHTIRHFTDEEALQLEVGYPDFDNHKKIHDDFKMTVNELMQKFKSGGSPDELSKDVNRIIVKWLVTHISDEDKKLSDYIRNISVAETHKAKGE